MAETTFITLDSTIEQVASLSNMWCRNEVVLKNLSTGQKLTKEQILGWLKVHQEVGPQDIPLDKGHFYYMNSSTRLTPKKVLEYAAAHNLPLRMFQEMIDALQVPGEPYLAWRQN